jgi:hypothetical protein
MAADTAADTAVAMVVVMADTAGMAGMAGITEATIFTAVASAAGRPTAAITVCGGPDAVGDASANVLRRD